MLKKLEHVNSNIKRIALQPIVRPVAISDDVIQPRFQVKLAKRLSDLYMLWSEYEHGIGGCKPARHFTPQERGKCKWLYSFRFGFWSLVEKMIRRGHTSDTAIDAVYRTYGRSTPVSVVLRAIRKDKASGGHPNLR